MAQGISLISGSPLIGNPIVYNVTPEVYAANRTFHRIIVRVYAKLETDDDYTTFDFSTPVDTKPSGASYSTQPSRFDISSALRAVADKYEYTPEPPERYPYIKFRIEAWDEWMVNGDTYSQQNVVAWPSLPVGDNQFYGYAFMGLFNDMERMNAQVDQNDVEYLNIERLSRKPLTTEIVFKNIPFVYPEAFYRGMEVDHMSDGVTPVSAAPTNERNAITAYKYDKTPDQSTVLAPDGSIVLLAYSDIETDNAFKVCHVGPASTHPASGSTGGGITWTGHKANIGDFYVVESDGDTYVATPTGWEISSGVGPKSIVHVPSVVGMSVVGGRSLYVADRPSNGYEIRFVNGLGCLESVHVTSCIKKEANIHTEKYTIARQETLKKFSRALTIKTEDYETWTLSSGPLDEDWASWYVHEFLMAQMMWIKVGDTWIPCHVLPEETTTIRDTEKASMMSVQFRIQLDVNGSVR